MSATMANKEHRHPWLQAYLDLADGKAPNCPACGLATLRLRYVVDPATRIGYALVWCESCKKGFHISRLKAPAGAPVSDINSETATEEIPELQFVDD